VEELCKSALQVWYLVLYVASRTSFICEALHYEVLLMNLTPLSLTLAHSPSGHIHMYVLHNRGDELKQGFTAVILHVERGPVSTP